MKAIVISFGLALAALTITPASAQWHGGYGWGGHGWGGHGWGGGGWRGGPACTWDRRFWGTPRYCGFQRGGFRRGW